MTASMTGFSFKDKRIQGGSLVIELKTLNPKQYPEKLIPKFKRLLEEDKQCTIHGTRCATIKRAFMHVEDVVDAVETVWKLPKVELQELKTYSKNILQNLS